MPPNIIVKPHVVLAIAPKPQRPVVLAGRQGVKGADGRDGIDGAALPQSGTFFAAPAAINMSGHRAVIQTNNGLDYASNDNPIHSLELVGVSLNAAIIGGTVNVVVLGNITEPSWNWIPNQPVFLGLNGYLTQAPPSSSGSFSLIIGLATSTTALFVSQRDAIFIGG
jgi:hypothetical protein